MSFHKLTQTQSRWPTCGALALTLSMAIPELILFGPVGRAQESVAVESTGSDWIQFKGDSPKTGEAKDSLSLPPALMWKHSSKPFFENPVSALTQGDRTYFFSERYVYCLDGEAGSIVWWQQVEGPIRATPALGDGLLFVPSTDSMLYAFQADSGAVVWMFPTSGLLRSHVLFHDGKVVFGSDDNNVYCLTAANGALEWKFSTGGDVISGPAARDGYYYFLSSDGNLYCAEADGKPYWRTPIPGGGQKSSSPAIGEDYIWLTNGKLLFGLRRRTGRVQHRISTDGEILSSPAMDDRNVYVGTKDGDFYAIDARSGRTTWKVNLGLPVLSTPTIVQNTILVGTTKGLVLALSADDGKTLWQYRIEWLSKGGNHVAASPTVSRGSLYIVGDNGALYGFKPWGMDLAAPETTDARVKLKARDGAMVYYSFDPATPSDPDPIPQLRGVPPILFSVTLTDLGSGVDPSSIGLTMNDEPKELVYNSVEGIVESSLGPQVVPGVAMRAIADGGYTIGLSAKDWRGNELLRQYKLIINNQLPPPDAVGKTNTTTDTGPGIGMPF